MNCTREQHLPTEHRVATGEASPLALRLAARRLSHELNNALSVMTIYLEVARGGSASLERFPGLSKNADKALGLAVTLANDVAALGSGSEGTVRPARLDKLLDDIAVELDQTDIGIRRGLDRFEGEGVAVQAAPEAVIDAILIARTAIQDVIRDPHTDKPLVMAFLTGDHAVARFYGIGELNETMVRRVVEEYESRVTAFAARLTSGCTEEGVACLDIVWDRAPSDDT